MTSTSRFSGKSEPSNSFSRSERSQTRVAERADFPGGDPLRARSISFWSLTLEEQREQVDEVFRSLQIWDVVGIQYLAPQTVTLLQLRAQAEGAALLASQGFGPAQLATVLLAKIPCRFLRLLAFSGEDLHEKDSYTRTEELARSLYTQWAIVHLEGKPRVLIGQISTRYRPTLEPYEPPETILRAITRLLVDFGCGLHIRRRSILMGDFGSLSGSGVFARRCETKARDLNTQIVACGSTLTLCAAVPSQRLTLQCGALGCSPRSDPFAPIVFFTWNVWPASCHDGFAEALRREQKERRDEHNLRQIEILLNHLEQLAPRSMVWCCLQEVESYFERELARELRRRGRSFQMFFQSSRGLLTLLLDAPRAAFRCLRLTDVLNMIFLQIAQVEHPQWRRVTCVNLHSLRPRGGRPDLKVDDLLEQIFSRLPERDLGTLVILGDFNRKDVAQEKFKSADWPVAEHLKEMNRKLRMTGQHFDFPYRRPSDYSPNDHIFIWTGGEVRNLHAQLQATWPPWQEVLCSDHFPLAVSLR